MIVDERVNEYIASLGAQPDPVLAAMEALAERRHFPIVGRQKGAVLGLLARCIGVHRVLELGSGYGYSALWLARALPDDGRILCTDHSADNRDLALGYFRTAGLDRLLEFRVGDAVAIAREQKPGLDLVFCDVDKELYAAILDVCIPLLRTGGLFVADNTLLKGRVADPGATDTATEAVRSLNRQAFERTDLEPVLLPVGDGLTICRKR
jgi:predicted O-methyltransferase YrrM